MLNIDRLFSDFENCRVLIVGDVMIDEYMWGSVDRISPEAPVPVVLLQNTDQRLGGAANVALNIKALGAEPYLFSFVGNDEAGQQFRELLPQYGISEKGIFKSNTRTTTVKTRVISNGQQLMRIDREKVEELSHQEVNYLVEAITECLETQEIDAILFQDYNKGVLSFRAIRKIMLEAVKRDIPTAVDPKYDHFMAYKHVTLFKPNLKEVDHQMDFEVKATEDQLLKASQFIQNEIGNQITLITLSEKGVFIHTDGQYQILPTQARQINDVCGAGDTVIAVATVAMACQVSIDQIGLLSNLAGGQVCEKVGIVPLNREQLKEEYLQLISKKPEETIGEE